MTTDDYRAAVNKGAPLNGSPIPAIWDPRLEAAMIASAVAVHEEAVIESLLSDLAAPCD